MTALAFVAALSQFSREHIDAVLSLLAIALVLGFIELRLRALFARHEVREEKMHATSQLISDAAAATAREASRHIAEIQAEVAEQRINVNNLSELLRVQEGRLAAVETRLTRAALAVPLPTIRGAP